MQKRNEVMSSLPKGSNYFNVIPTKENVDYNRIYEFTDSELVSKFGFYGNNREFENHRTKLKNLTNDIINYGAQFIDNIRVDINTLKIADGQHRVVAFLNAWEKGSTEPLKVRFEDYPINEKKAMDIISKINSTNNNWSISDYSHRLECEENKHILNVKEFATNHSLCHEVAKKGNIRCKERYAYAILFGYNATPKVKDGTICITHKELDFGEQLHKELEQMTKALNYDINSWFESFAQAWYEVRHDELYNREIAKIGFDRFADNLFDEFRGYNTITRKTEWLMRFRKAITEISRKIDNKEIA